MLLTELLVGERAKLEFGLSKGDRWRQGVRSTNGELGQDWVASKTRQDDSATVLKTMTYTLQVGELYGM